MTVKQQENGRWLVQVNRTGLPRVRRSFDDEKSAEIFERDYIYKQTQARPLDADNRTLLELCNIWYRYHGINLADGERRLGNVRRMSEALGNPVAALVTPAQFLEFRYQRTHVDEDRIAGKTFNNQHGYLNAVYRKLRKLKVIDYECPIGEVDMIKLQERQATYLSSAEITELFTSLNQSLNRDVAWVSQICIRTGSRWGEAEQLTRRQLHSNRLTYVNTKSKRTRTVQVDPEFMGLLVGHIGKKNPNDRIFKNSRNAYDTAVRRSSLQLPQGQLTHILRHTFASYFMINGGNILNLREILGHSDIKMTMRYAHLAPDHSADAVRYNPLANKNGLAVVTAN